MSGAEWRSFKPIRICARLVDLWCEKEHPGHYILFCTHNFGHTLHLPNEAVLDTSKSAPDWVSYKVKLGCKRAPGALSPYLYTVFQWNWPQASSRMSNSGVLSPSKFATQLGAIVHGVKLGCKLAQCIFLLIYTQDLNESRSFSVDCRV